MGLGAPSASARSPCSTAPGSLSLRFQAHRKLSSGTSGLYLEGQGGLARSLIHVVAEFVRVGLLSPPDRPSGVWDLGRDTGTLTAKSDNSLGKDKHSEVC